MRQRPMELKLSDIVVIVGNYGSGKTEVAINLAADQKDKGIDVRVADLDLVNPYFRTREAQHTLSNLGIDMILPAQGWLKADLPILSPQVAGLIRHPGELAIFDVGGDGVGATVLAALADAFHATRARVQLLQVVNPFRPNTDTVDHILKMQKKIEAACGLGVTAWVGNAHLMDETTIDHIEHGYGLLRELSRISGLPLRFMSVAESLIDQVKRLKMACPVLTLRRQLVPPWGARAQMRERG